MLWLALRKARLILGVFVNLVCGLLYTAAVGLWMVGTLNLISVAFAVLFVGLGVDFSIQFCVRYRSERHACGDLGRALLATARGIGHPLLLAAASIAAGFFSFLPTAYRGLSELGLIAGVGIIIGLATTLTLLPAFLTVLKPPPEQKPIGYAALAPVDRFLEKRRNWVVGTTLAVAIVGLPLLAGLRFDFNPINLRAKDTESVATLLDLMNDPDTSPITIDILGSDFAQVSATVEKLGQLPEVGRVLTLQSFVPESQDAKLALIEDAGFFLQNTLSPDEISPELTQAETEAAIGKLVADLSEATRGLDSPAAIQARRLAAALTDLAKAPPAALNAADHALITPLRTTLRQTRNLLNAEKVNIADLPSALKKSWVSTDGRVRVEVAPKGDGNDNAILRRFVTAVRGVAPEATGQPVFIIEAAATVIRHFPGGHLVAGLDCIDPVRRAAPLGRCRPDAGASARRHWSRSRSACLSGCSSILPTSSHYRCCWALALRSRFTTSWRGARETDFLQSSLTRAIFFSACTTAIAFGACVFASPGHIEYGRLMALSLLTTLAAAVLFQPASWRPSRSASVSQGTLAGTVAK